MRISISYAQLFVSLFVLIVGVAGLLGYIYSDDLYEHFRDKTPHDLIMASGYSVQAQSSQDFIFADPQIVQLIDPKINAQSSAKVTSTRLEQLRKRQQEEIGVSRIISDMTRHMQGELVQDELAEVVRWYQTPLGKKVVSVENRATSLDNYPQQQNLATQTIDAQAEPERVRLINRLVLVMKSLADSSLPIFPHRAAINLSVAQSHRYGKIKTIGFVGGRLSFAKEVDQENLYHQFKAMLHFTYKELSDDELSGYCDFLASPVGGKSYIVLSRAFQKALFEAVSDYNALIKQETKFHNSLELENPVRNILAQVDKFGRVRLPTAEISEHTVKGFSSPEDVPVINEQTSQIEATVNQGFGLEYQLLGEPGNARVPITIRLRHPPFQDPATGVVRTETRWKRIPKLAQTAIAYWRFEHDWQLVSGEWALQITYQGETLAEQKFNVTAKGQGTLTAGQHLVTDKPDDEEDVYRLSSFGDRVRNKYLVPGGQYLLLDGNRALAIWDVIDRQLDPQRLKLGAVRSPYSKVVVDPQGRSFLAALASRQLSLRFFDDERTQYFLDESSAGYMSIGMAYSASGSKIVTLHDDTIHPARSSFYDPTVSQDSRTKKLPNRKPITRIWDSSNGESLARIVDLGMPVIDPSERYVAGISGDNKITFHELATGKRIFQVARRSAPAEINKAPAKTVLLKPSPSGDYLLACSQDGALTLIDFKGRQVVREIPLDSYISVNFANNKIDFDPSGRFLIADGRFIRVWSVETGELACDVKSPNGSVLDLKSILIDTRHNQAVASLRYNLLIFDLDDGRLIKSYFNEFGALGMNASHQKLIADRGGALEIIDLDEGKMREAFGLKGSLYQMDDPGLPNSYGRTVVLTQDMDMSLQLWDPFTGEPVNESSLSIRSGGLQIDNGVWVVNGYEGGVRVIDKKTGQGYSIKAVSDDEVYDGDGTKEQPMT